jgi:5-methylcytosine-specific restriction endonuclease McrA
MPISADNRLRYPPYWRQLSHLVRFAIDRGMCRFCGALHGQPHPVTGSKVVLTTAHLVDMRPEADRLENLAGFCQRCHNRHDIEHRRQTRRRKCAVGELL